MTVWNEQASTGERCEEMAWKRKWVAQVQRWKENKWEKWKHQVGKKIRGCNRKDEDFLVMSGEKKKKNEGRKMLGKFKK